MGIAVADLEPLTIVALRVGLAAIALNVIMFAMGLSMPRDYRFLTVFFGMGLLNNIEPSA